MSDTEEPARRGRPARGRRPGRGRPSRLDVLRREAFEDVRAEANHLAPAAHGPAAAGPELALAPAAPPPAPVVIPIVTTAMVAACRDPLPIQPSHPFAGMVAAYANAAEGRMDEFASQSTVEFAERLWSPTSNVWHAATRTASAAAADLTAHRHQRMERRLVAAAELSERETQYRAQTALATPDPNVELVAFVEGARYDESTALLSTTQPVSDYLLAANIPPGELSAELARVLEHNQPKENVPTRIFQTECQWFALLAVPGPSGDPAQPKKYTLVSSDTVTTPQQLQRNTTECVAAALAASSTCRPQTVSKFKLKMRLVCSDRGAYNMSAERLIQRHRGDWLHLFLPCEVHMSTSCQSKGLRLMDNMVGRLIRTALSMRLGGWMRLFRKCLLQEIVATVEVLEGVSTADAALYRNRAALMFLKDGIGSRKIRAVLSALPNGDWRKDDRVQVFVPPGTAWSRLPIALLVAKALISAMGAGNFRVFNRKRWTNNDLAVNQFGILEACHKLFSRTYKRWLREVGYDGPLCHLLREAVAPVPVPADAYMMIEDAVGDGDGGELGAPIVEGPAGEDDTIAPGGEGAPDQDDPNLELALPSGAATEGTDFAALNRQNRSVGAAWVLQGCPLRDLVLARVVMEPCMVVLKKQLRMGSRRWETEEDVKLLGAEACRRKYRLLVCARGELDTAFAAHQQKVMWSPALFSVVPESHRTEQLSCLAFRMHTLIGAEYERLLASRHRKPPFQLFLATQSQQVASEVKALHENSPCRLDSFSKEFLDSHSLEDADSLAILKTIMAVSHVDTSMIECWHAWTRRVVTRLGTQTNRPAAADVFARHVAQRLKRRTTQNDMWHSMGEPSEGEPAGGGGGADAAGDSSGGGQVKRKRGGGGAWRAHCSKKMRAGERLPGGGFAASYRSRTEDEIAEDGEAGERATRAHRLNLASFGLSRRQSAVARIHNAALAMNRMHAADTDGRALTDASAIATLAGSGCTAESYEDLTKILRRADKVVASEARAADLRVDQAARAFADTRGKALVGAAASDIAAANDFRDIMFASPSDASGLGIERIQLEPNSQATATRAMAFDTEEGHERSSERNLGVGLDAYWSARSKAICAEEWTGPPDDGPRKESMCFLAGRCLCSAEGRKLKRFRNKFMENHKLLTMRGTPERQMLTDAFLVWRLRGVPREPLLEGLLTGEGSGSESIDEDTYLFWHMPMVLLNPYLPVFHTLECESVDRGEKPAPHAELAVKVVCGVEFQKGILFRLKFRLAIVHKVFHISLS